MKDLSERLELVFIRFASDDAVTPWHISLYMSVFCLWSGLPDEAVPITRAKLMKLSAINSFVTYHKCLRELQEHRYIRYIPSFNPLTGSTIYLLFE